MREYLIFCGEDFSDHTNGFLQENHDGAAHSIESMLTYVQTVAKNKAWTVLCLVEVVSISGEIKCTKLWEQWTPIVKKLVLDPKKITKPKVHPLGVEVDY